MSKELTEQWRNGELKTGLYYIKSKSGRKVFALHTNSASHLFTPYNRYTLETKEVLAPVPDYDEWKTAYECQLMESEEVLTLKEQLKEANEVIKFYANSFLGDKQKDGTYLICTRENVLGRVEVTYNPNIASNYIKKWGVK